MSAFPLINADAWCRYAQATSGDAPHPGYCGEVTVPGTQRCAAHATADIHRAEILDTKGRRVACACCTGIVRLPLKEQLW